MQSIVQTEPGIRCYICGYQQYLEKHHCIHGTANRRLAEEDGLFVYLCQFCHRIDRTAVHGPDGKENDLMLKQDAERAWIEHYGTEKEFINRYGKSWL